MASKRMLQSALFDNDFFGSLDFFERLLWIGLFGVVADDQGRFWKRLIKIHAAIFPCDEFSDELITKAMEKYVKAGKVVEYKVGNKTICQLVGWWKHQRPSWAMPSKYDAPTGWIDREKHHHSKKVFTENWDCIGGYCEVHSIIPTDKPIAVPMAPCNRILTKKKEKPEKQDKSLGKPIVVPTAVPTNVPTAVGGSIDNSIRNRNSIRNSIDKQQEGMVVDKPNIFTIYERNIGLIPNNVKIVGELKDADSKYPVEWLDKAFTIGVENNVRKWSYVRAILDNWDKHGFDKNKKQSTREMLAEWEAEEE